ncbi:MAG: hypothetical protein IJD92_01805 [Bacilli bacterium]|nr:hypothetical protein [Bacilli bacterium]
MNRKTTITICIVAIIMVTISLLGFTYGFYINRVIGNTNQKTVEAISGLDQVEITDISNETISEIIRPGYTYTKIFTVKNTGDLDSTYSIYLMDVENNFIRKEDIVYTLYRKNGNNTIDSSDLSTAEIVASGIYPSGNAIILKDEKLNNSNDTYTYALKVEYIYHENIDQNDDQGHRFKGVVHIYGTHTEADNPFIGGTLAYEILKSAKTSNETGYATYSETPQTRPGKIINGSNEATLSLTTDNDGNTYYFRGNVINNYINFAGMCWKIVRINGDETTRLILEDAQTTCETSTGNYRGTSGVGAFGYDSANKINYLNPTSSTSMQATFKTFQTNKLSNYLTYLEPGNWCFEDKGYNTSVTNLNAEGITALGSITLGNLSSYYSSGIYYTSYIRLEPMKEPSLECTGTILTDFNDGTDMYVATLTAEETTFAGYKWAGKNPNNYLTGAYTWWTLTPTRYNNSKDEAFWVNVTGDMWTNYATNIGYRPAINLSNKVLITGIGTKNEPYKVVGTTLQ